MSSEVWVVGEHRGGHLRRITLELISEGRRLADGAKGRLSAILLGEDLACHADTLAHYGADRVVFLQDSRFALYEGGAYAASLSRLVSSSPPAILLLGATSQGKDLAPRVAALLGLNLASDCTSFSLGENGELAAIRPVYAGKALATVKWEGKKPWMATLRPNIAPLLEPDLSRSPEVEKPKLELEVGAWKARILEVAKDATATVDLTEAEIIVSGGRGMKGPENFSLLEDLAGVLGGAVGASRAAVDSGWRGHQSQVGQTGKVVSPKLYFACGISGSVQHLAGISSAKFIVAINKDPDAPIFKVADYGIVDDLFVILPLLTEEFRRLLGTH
jgi:electron transfer flavoprotein alpha subunit